MSDAIYESDMLELGFIATPCACNEEHRAGISSKPLDSNNLLCTCPDVAEKAFMLTEAFGKTKLPLVSAFSYARCEIKLLSFRTCTNREI